MGEVAWGTAFCDLIKNNSGKFPAIVGFDYIHLASSPSNWIDYGDITPVQTVGMPAVSPQSAGTGTSRWKCGPASLKSATGARFASTKPKCLTL